MADSTETRSGATQTGAGDFEAYPLTRSEYIAALVHFYRGERSRADAWRARDGNTLWIDVEDPSPGEVYAPERHGRGVLGWPRSQQALLAIRDECRTAKVPLLLLDHTLPPIPSLPPFCAEHDIACAELRFSSLDHRLGITNSMLDTHANARGHQLLLERLQRILTERHLLPE